MLWLERKWPSRLLDFLLNMSDDQKCLSVMVVDHREIGLT